MSGYSDRTHHALAFAAKHLSHDRAMSPAAAARPASMAVILTRYGCEEVTIVAGILHPVIAATVRAERASLTRRLVEKFGPVAVAVASEAQDPEAASERMPRRTWETECVDLLGHLATLEPRTLSLRAAEEILDCGTILSDIRRLGPEYLPTVTAATGQQLLWWFHAVAETLDRHEEWPRREMLGELRLLTGELAEELAE